MLLTLEEMGQQRTVDDNTDPRTDAPVLSDHRQEKDEGLFHGPVGRLKYSTRIDLSCRGTPCRKQRMRRQELERLFPLALTQQLRIVDERSTPRIRDGAGARINWTRQRPPARLIDPDDDIQFIPGLDSLLKER